MTQMMTERATNRRRFRDYVDKLILNAARACVVRSLYLFMALNGL